ncbi:YhdP family protein [Alteromonas ponticola]|uniref:YhdP family protein n=1 Tax=Alteromonas aquimaris TaxID=2998417 RepID=A0ABT3PAL7_9ALTE|nr:YhdP family protein [Alteromonas aquimaris]MCW8109828.1 YhdP family protein [Alteromonas aquimaris]
MSKVTQMATVILRKLWVTLAILLVVFAVFLSVLRYALPHIEHKKYMLEDYARNIYGVELSIDEVHAVWESAGPSIVLTNVALQQNESSPVALTIQNVFVQLNLWQSLFSGKISSEQFHLSDLQLTINTQQVQQSETDFPIVSALKSLFLEQLKSFSLHDGKITLAGPASNKTFNIKHLTWLNDDEIHRGEGQVSVEALTRNTATFLIDLRGNKDDLSGTLYAKGVDLDISPWVAPRLAVTRPLAQSKANVEAWVEVRQSKLDRVAIDFHESLLEWGGDDAQPFYSGIMGGSFQALPDDAGWNFRIDRLIFNANNESIVTDLVGHYSHNGNIVINTIKPVAVNPFLDMLPLLTTNTQDDNYSNLHPQGQLATLQFQWKDRQPYVSAKLLGVSWNQQGQLPGIDALDIDVNWYGNSGVVWLGAKNATLVADNNFAHNLPINHLQGKLYVYEQDNSWFATSEKFTIASEPLTIIQSFNLQLDNLHLAYQADLSSVPLNKVGLYLPAATMGIETANYLTNALAGPGQVQSAQVLWHGQLNQFPYADNNGIFQAAVEIQNSHFLFSESWPTLTDLNLTLLFENAGLSMFAPAAKLQTITVKELVGHIPDMLGTHPVLTIHAEGRGTGQDLASLMQNSEMQPSLGVLFNDELLINGGLNADLDLSIPLSQSGEVIATGKVRLSGNNIKVDALGLTLANASGEVSFHNDVVSASGLHAAIFDQPFQFDFSGKFDDDRYLVDIRAEGEVNINEMLSAVNSPLIDYLEGAAPVTAQIDLTLPDEGFSYTAKVDADLLAVASALPAPLNKKQNVAQSLQLVSEGNAQSSIVTATAGPTIQFDGVLSHPIRQFTRAHVSLGENDFVSQGVGLSIFANVDTLNADDWYDLVNALSGQATSSSAPLFTLPERIILDAKTVEVAGLTLTNVKATSKQKNNDWLIDLHSNQARAQVNLFNEWLIKGVNINADYINIDSWQMPAADEKVKWHAESLPPFYFYCQQCRYADKQLGEVTLDMVKTPDGMSIRTLRAQGKHGVITATGNWFDDNQRSETQLSGRVTSDEIGLMLSNFGLDTGIKDSEADMTFTLNWSDSPMDFSVANLGGEMKWELSDGYLSELSDKGSRLFTLFSFNSLIRKLSLDFRDVFAKGFFYDEIKGSMQIANGKAVTKDTEVDGGAGEITIKGYTDLVQEKLNYHVSFTPNVTGNLPFLVYFLATPPTALAALALDQVLTSAKVISNVNYRVTGTISNPVFEEVGRDSKNVPLPAMNEPTGENDTIKQDLEPVKLEVNNG